MGMINMSGSMKFGPSGKRRKTNAWKQKKRHQMKMKQMSFDRAYPQGYKEQNVIPSLTSSKGAGEGTKNLKLLCNLPNKFVQHYPSCRSTSLDLTERVDMQS